MCFGVALVLGAVAGSATRRPAPSYAVAMNYAVGRVPGALSIADLNGDGKPDLVTTNPYGQLGNTVSVLLNRGDGTLEGRVEYKAGLHPAPAVVRDLNGDGRPDIAEVSYGSSRVAVKLNRGDGTFAALHSYPVGKNPDEQLVIADLNGDGKPELLTSSYTEKTVSVLMNAGGGTFAPKRDYRVGRPVTMAIGDVNADGAPDLAVANAGASTVSVFINEGDGTFRPKRNELTGPHPSWIAVADVNRDGRPDIVTASCYAGWRYSGKLWVLLNKGDGTFRERRGYRVGDCLTLGVGLADLNGDRAPDFVVSGTGEDLAGPPSNWIAVLLNSGSGAFGAPRHYASVRGGATTWRRRA